MNAEVPAPSPPSPASVDEVRYRPEERAPQAGFAHPSEAEFARILDFYQIAWQYEPRSFPLRYDDSGRIIESFTPDFYLPDWDLYVELTTLKQSLVTKKNRKLRRLRELYPDVTIKLLYRRDFISLLRKFGLSVDAAGLARQAAATGVTTGDVASPAGAPDGVSTPSPAPQAVRDGVHAVEQPTAEPVTRREVA